MTRSGPFHRFLFLPFFLFLAGLHLLAAQTAPWPDNSAARRQARDLLIASLTGVETGPAGDYLALPDGTTVRYERRVQDGLYYQLFINQEDGRFAVFNRGSYVIRRDAQGRVDQIKVFLRSDPAFFVRLQPSGRGVEMEVSVAGYPLHRSIHLNIDMDRLLTASFREVMNQTRRIVDWDFLLTRPIDRRYGSVEAMARAARAALHTLPDAEDGAMDAQGNLVFIESLVLQDQGPGFNCSGFAKWIVDGLYKPRTGGFMEIEALKRKHTDLRGTQLSGFYEEARDPYFGLDWSRNLAVTMGALDRGVDANSLHPESADVRVSAFDNYIEDVGFEVARLPIILYELALREPGHFYIASLNRDFGTAPRLHQHTHIAVIFPYFTQTGEYRVAVMERNVETGLDSLLRRYESDFVHLVRIRASSDYEPPVIRY